jgi:hypothetical protein
MTTAAGRVSGLAAWALECGNGGAVPEQVLAAAASQRASIYGAIAGAQVAGLSMPAVHRHASRGSPLDGPLAAELSEALASAAAYDFDDYMCFGHVGLTSVLVPAVLADHVGADHRRVVASQVAAAEVQARIAGACLLGPHGPTQWCFTHTVGAATAAGILFGLDERGLANALAIALTRMAPVPAGAFFGPDTRVSAVTSAVVAGVRAAAAAADGETGPADALDTDGSGALGLLVRRPLPAMVSGLGHGWAMTTLSVKTRASCSYVDPVLDALEALGPLDVDAIDSVDVVASAPTCVVERLAARAVAGRALTPATVSFSARLSAATLLRNGRLTPVELAPGRLAADEPATRALAERVHVTTSKRHTLRMSRGLARTFHLAAQLRPSKRVGPRPTDDAGVWRQEALGGYRMEFPATVTVRLRGGRSVSVTRAVPRGAAGSSELGAHEAALAKLHTWGGEAWGEEATGQLARCVSLAADRCWGQIADAVLAGGVAGDRTGGP